jgi:hypothetical protein
MTQAALTAVVNALLANGIPITAAIHRSAEGNIITELYNANSRGAVLALVTQQVSFSGGDELLVVRGGATVRIPYTAASASKWRGAFDASVNAYPSTGGSGSAGAILAGDEWYASVGGNLDVSGLGVITISIGALIKALVNTPGTTPANWRVVQ